MSDIDRLKKDLEEIKHELASLKKGSRAYRALERDKAELQAQLIGAGAIAQGDRTVAAGEGATVVQESIIVNAEKGAQVVIGTEPVKMSRKVRDTVLGRYLEHIIAHNRYLQLHGIRSGGRLVNIELEHIYITLRTAQEQTVQTGENWLYAEMARIPGELARIKMEESALQGSILVTVEQAMARHRHMVILGNPGSGKTTLLRYLALVYGRDLAENTNFVWERIKLDETGYLPILLHLRQFGSFLKEHHARDDGTEGHALLFEFMFLAMKGFRIDLPDNFFDEYFQSGKAIILLDGMDEVENPDLRARVARMVEAFTLAYPKCRFVITSRLVGYIGVSRLTGDYVTTTVRDFTLEDVEQFLKHWHRLVAVGQLGSGESADIFAESQTAQLMSAIRDNERIRDLAINPLLLTVIALVHRDRVKLPDRRAELYAEAVDVLLGKWDEARGVGGIPVLEDRPFEVSDKRLVLQALALRMHERGQKEIRQAELFDFLEKYFSDTVSDTQKRRLAIGRFERVIEERTGLLLARGEGVYTFSHLTFQEYLAARALAGRDDYVEYTLRFINKAWWREVILLEVGQLGCDSTERASRLIRAIAQNRRESLPYHNLVLALEALHDAGAQRVDPRLFHGINDQLDEALKSPPPVTTRIFQNWDSRGWIDQRTQLVQALAQVGKGYWTLPHGEPDWIKIPARKFWMGIGTQIREVELSEYQIARVPITNAQYALFVQDAKFEPPPHWEKARPPRGRASHPVVNVNWYDALKYCEWLSEKIGKHIILPSETEWEKAARSNDKREYPWGRWKENCANTSELGVKETTPVGIFLGGASPYGVLDLIGNVLEWTRSNYHNGNDDLESKDQRVLRGGSFSTRALFACCASRNADFPDIRNEEYGFRVVIAPIFPSS